jgi:aldose 1-epimerase
MNGAAAPLTLTAGDALVVVDPGLGARVSRWSVDGLDLLGARGTAPQEHGCYPMAPWVGRVRDNLVTVAGVSHPLPPTYAGWAIHGTVLARPWTVERSTTSEVELWAPLGIDWPWPGRARLSWAISEQALTSTLSVESDDDAFPADVGWHPWFRRHLDRGGPLTYDLQATGLLERGPDHLPTGRLLDPSQVPGPYDDAFAVPDGRLTLRWPGALTMSVDSDARWYVVFDELADFVCLEPQTGPPDGLSAAATLVRPGRPRIATTTWSWQVDASA